MLTVTKPWLALKQCNHVARNIQLIPARKAATIKNWAVCCVLLLRAKTWEPTYESALYPKS